MVIYGEYLFLENFITGLLILFFTGKIAGERLVLIRILICGICCGLYAFSMFTAMGALTGIISRLLFMAGISWIAFGKKSLKRLCLNGVLFFAVTVLYGGVTIALLSAFSWQGVAASEGVYLPVVTYAAVTSAAIAAALLVWFIVSLIKEQRRLQRTRVHVTLRMGDKSWNMQGFIDSGNFLKEPFTGRPVAVVRKSMMEQILKNYGDKTVRYMAIPYSSVGTEKGVLDGYRIDALTAGEQTVKKPVLAVCRDEEFFAPGNERGQILLPESMLERGIYADLEDNQNIFAKAAKGIGKEYFLHRGKRCTSAAAEPGRGTENAGRICKGQPGGEGSTH